MIKVIQPGDAEHAMLSWRRWRQAEAESDYWYDMFNRARLTMSKDEHAKLMDLIMSEADLWKEVARSDQRT